MCPFSNASPSFLRVCEQADQVKQEHEETCQAAVLKEEVLDCDWVEVKCFSTITAPDWFVIAPNCLTPGTVNNFFFDGGGLG